MSKKPRLIIPRLPAINAGPELDASEASQDRAFIAKFSAEAIAVSTTQVKELLKTRGWATLTRNGIHLNSPEAFEEDRMSAAAFNTLNMMVTYLRPLVMTADAKIIRSLRIAYESGAATAELTAYRHNAAGRGRKPRKDMIYGVIGAAAAKWKKANPMESRRPRPKELVKLAVGVSDKWSLPTGRQFGNYVSKFRKIQKNEKL